MKKEVAKVLDDWHDAAAKADEKRYFSHFSKDAVFLGTDPRERWNLAAFRRYAKPFFARGWAWTLVASERSVSFSKAGDVAWADERVDSPFYGRGRGVAVLVKEGGAWKIAQYGYSLPIPEEHLPAVLKLLKS